MISQRADSSYHDNFYLNLEKARFMGFIVNHHLCMYVCMYVFIYLFIFSVFL